MQQFIPQLPSTMFIMDHFHEGFVQNLLLNFHQNIVHGKAFIITRNSNHKHQVTHKAASKLDYNIIHRWLQLRNDEQPFTHHSQSLSHNL